MQAHRLTLILAGLFSTGVIAAGAAIGFLMRSYVELVRIIADMLLPR